jgi:hypothetical protein
MVKEFSQLDYFILESIKPDRLLMLELTEKDFKKWSEFVNRTVRSIQVYINQAVNIATSKAFRNLLPWLNKLIDLINTTFSYTRHKDLRQRSLFSKILAFYKFTCEHMENLLSPLRDHVAFKRLRISNLELPRVKMELKTDLTNLCLIFTELHSHDSLFSLVTEILKRRITKRKLTWQDYQRLKGDIHYLLKIKKIDSYDLFDAIIAIDFDYPEILHYQVEMWRTKIADIADIRSQIEFLVKERHRLTEIAFLSEMRKLFKENQLMTDLTGYLSEYEQFLNQILVLQRNAAQDEVQTRSGRRFQVSLSVAQLGLFIRLLLEKGILPKENISQLFKFFAEHFYTANALFISPENLQKKSTDVEFSTAQKMKTLLISMVNWLNANYNLSNYS